MRGENVGIHPDVGMLSRQKWPTPVAWTFHLTNGRIPLWWPSSTPPSRGDGGDVLLVCSTLSSKRRLISSLTRQPLVLFCCKWTTDYGVAIEGSRGDLTMPSSWDRMRQKVGHKHRRMGWEGGCVAEYVESLIVRLSTRVPRWYHLRGQEALSGLTRGRLRRLSEVLARALDFASGYDNHKRKGQKKGIGDTSHLSSEDCLNSETGELRSHRIINKQA